MPAEGHPLFSEGKKVGKKPAAASAALEVAAEACPVIPAPVDAERR